MSTEHTISARAADGSLTMAELRAFLDRYDKAMADTGPVAERAARELRPKARVSFGGGLKSITVTVPG